LVAGLLGFLAAAMVAKIIFYIAFILFLISLSMGLAVRRIQPVPAIKRRRNSPSAYE